MDPQEILGYFMSGEGRLMAAGMLFVTIAVLKRAPFVGPWLAVNSGWLTSKRKKTAANVLSAMAPVAFMLTTDASMREVLVAALEIMLIAAGIHSKQKSVRAVAPPPAMGDEEREDLMGRGL